MSPSETSTQQKAHRSLRTDTDPVTDRRESTGDQSKDLATVETGNLTKRYGDITAVDGLNLTVRRGEVYGFLGPNGAGKTTTLRMLLGLVRPTSGTATVLGEQPGAGTGLARTGALVESPAFYPYLSGRRNLCILARYADVPQSRVDAVLNEVTLTTRAGDPFKTYSLGMKQRLGVAAALLKDPELLILDEPTNGLDPKGMTEMRTLIRDIGQGNRTVLLSSHLMGEVEQICDRIGVIQHGELIAEGTVEAFQGQAKVLVRGEPLTRAKQITEEMSSVEDVHVSDNSLRLTMDTAHTGDVAHKLVTSGVTVRELRPVEQSLEETFLKLTEDEEEQ